MHPTLSRYIARLAGLSSAKTAKGILAFVRKNPVALLPLTPRKRTSEDWKSSEESRKWTTQPTYNRDLATHATQIAKESNKRLSNWNSPVPRVQSVKLGSVFSEGFRYKGKFSGYKGSTYHPEYNSYFRVARNSGGVCEYYADNALIRRRLAPKGLRFSLDALGVRVIEISSGVDYHFYAEDFAKKDFAAFVRREIANKKRLQAHNQREAKKRQEIEKALHNPKKLAKVWVTRDDSLESGNCQAGTDRFIETAFRESSGIGAARADWLMEKWPSPAVVSAVRRALLRSCV